MKIKKIVLIILIIIIIGNLLPIYSFSENESDNIVENNVDIFNDISAPNILLAETHSGRILYERKIDKKIYPASLTKLMTAILVVENCELDEIVTVSENAVKSVPSGYVNANLQVGEELTVEDLLNVMLIPSANDAANVLAEHVAGSIESFSSMMNTKAIELGCKGSNFTNPSGLQEKEHYTTVRDLYYISQKAIENETIKKIIGKTSYSLPKTNKYDSENRVFTTTNYMKRKNLSNYYCDYCIGGKTGYTGDAKNCVIEFVQKDGIELIGIVMGENAKIKGQKFLDAKEMFEYVFKNYKNEQVSTKNEKYETVKVSNATKETNMLDVLYNKDVYILNNNVDEIQHQTEYYNIKAPITQGEVVGKITYKLGDIEYSTDLIAGSNVEESKILRNILCILVVVIIIYIIYFNKKSKKNYKRKIKKYNKKERNKLYY